MLKALKHLRTHIIIATEFLFHAQILLYEISNITIYSITYNYPLVNIILTCFVKNITLK